MPSALYSSFEASTAQLSTGLPTGASLAAQQADRKNDNRKRMEMMRMVLFFIVYSLPGDTFHNIINDGYDFSSWYPE
jgi:hypothetical protein